VLLPLAFFFSVLTPDATEPNAMIYLAYVGAASLAAGLLVLGVGLIRRERERTQNEPLGKEQGR
jgi:predicted permease